MRRLGVAIAVLCLAAASLGVSAATPVGAAGVPGYTNVTLVNAYSFAGGHIFDGAFCVGGLLTVLSTEQSAGPTSTPSGSTTINFYNSDSVSCGVDTPTASATVDLPDQGDVTIMAYWPAGGPQVVMLNNTIDCIASDSGRLTVRNGGDVGGTGAIDVYGTPPGGSSTKLLSNIAAGAQGTVDLPVGTYTNLIATNAGTQTQVATIANSVVVAGNSVQYAYVYGGDDGEPGGFLGATQELNTCAVTTTTAAPATTTTAPPAAAKAVQATPAFTG